MSKKKTLEDQINQFLEIWSGDDLIDLMRILCRVFESCDHDESDFPQFYGKDQEEIANMRIIYAVYMLSQIAEKFSGKLLITKMNLPRLYERMEKVIKDQD
jgi:hypothetical protein